MYVPEIQFYSTDVLPGIMKNCKKNEQDFSSFWDDFFAKSATPWKTGTTRFNTTSNEVEK